MGWTERGVESGVREAKWPLGEGTINFTPGHISFIISTVRIETEWWIIELLWINRSISHAISHLPLSQSVSQSAYGMVRLSFFLSLYNLIYRQFSKIRSVFVLLLYLVFMNPSAVCTLAWLNGLSKSLLKRHRPSLQKRKEGLYRSQCQLLIARSIAQQQIIQGAFYCTLCRHWIFTMHASVSTMATGTRWYQMSPETWPWPPRGRWLKPCGTTASSFCLSVCLSVCPPGIGVTGDIGSVVSSSHDDGWDLLDKGTFYIWSLSSHFRIPQIRQPCSATWPTVWCQLTRWVGGVLAVSITTETCPLQDILVNRKRWGTGWPAFFFCRIYLSYRMWFNWLH